VAQLDPKTRRVIPQEKTCEWCGGAFTPRRSDARTCSPAHRQALHRFESGKSKTAPPVTASRDKAATPGAPTERNVTDKRDTPRTEPAQKGRPVGRAGARAGVRKPPTASNKAKRPKCAWVGGCDAPATHGISSAVDHGPHAKRSETGWSVTDYYAKWCLAHAEQEARTPHCQHDGCERRATHRVSMFWAGGSSLSPHQAEKASSVASYCKPHAEAKATADNRDTKGGS
jgi:hypothetical protein